MHNSTKTYKHIYFGHFRSFGEYLILDVEEYAGGSMVF